MNSRIRSAIVWLQVQVLVFVLFGVTDVLPQKVSKGPIRQPAINKASKAAESYSVSNYKTSVSFTPNMGQTDSQVKYVGYGLGYGLFLTSNEAVFQLSRQETAKRKPRDRGSVRDNTKSRDSVLRMKFVNANNDPKVVPYEELQGKRNYLFKERNISGVPNYSKVEFENLYDGVDLTYYSKEQSLEYDLAVAPNTEVSKVRFAFEGADNIRINRAGDLVIRIGGEEIVHKKPDIYQQNGGKRQSIQGKYVIDLHRQVGFEVGQYDKSKPLIIDPIIVFSTYLGGVIIGSRLDYPDSIAADKEGNVYVVGGVGTSDFPRTTGTTPPPPLFQIHVFVTKFDASGQLVFSTYWGGSEWDYGTDLKVDSSGNIFVTGYTESDDFPTVNAIQPSRGAPYSSDAFVSKLNATGTALLFSTYLGGSSIDWANALALGASGDVYIAGISESIDLPTTTGAFQEDLFPGTDQAGFVAKLNSAGSSLNYLTYLQGLDMSGTESVYTTVSDIVVDGDGNAFVTGDTDSLLFPTTPLAFQTKNAGYEDGFVSKLNSSGSDLIYSTLLGGSDTEEPAGVGLDGVGNIYVAGSTWSVDFPAPSGPTHGGDTDIYVTKFDPTLSTQSYSRFIGGSSYDDGYDMKVDADGSAFTVGYTDSPNFPVTNGAFRTSVAGIRDAVVVKLNPSGSSLTYSTLWGGSADDYATSLDISACGDVFITGSTLSPNIPMRRAYQSSLRAIFIAKLTFLKTTETAPDASTNGPLATTVSEYRLPAVEDLEVLELDYNDPDSGPQALKVELWARVHRPAVLAGPHPVLAFLHGMHQTCVRNSVPAPPGSPSLPPDDRKSYWYPLTGRCDDLNTPAFDENDYYDVIQNHQGYDYLAQRLASWGYVVISVNANRGIHAESQRVLFPHNYPDPFLILPRARLILRHLQKLREWNDCTVDPNCQSLPHTGVDLRGKLDFGNVGLMGHSRGGQGVRAAYNLYKTAGSPWQSRIPGLNVKATFEIAPTDKITNEGGIIADPDSRYIAYGTKWNVLIPMCDSDVFGLDGVRVFDRMLIGTDNPPSPNPPNNDNPATQKSTYTVWGANHNFFNTVWNYHDLNLDNYGVRCVDNDPLFELLASGSEKQRQIALSGVLAFFRANVGNTSDSNYNKILDPVYDSHASIQAITRVERGFIASPNPSQTKVFDDFKVPTTNTYDVGNSANVSYQIGHIAQHDPTLNVAILQWTASGNGNYFQSNWSSAGSGVDVSSYQTLDFRVSRVRNVGLNPNGPTNISIQLVSADGSTSAKVKICEYIHLDGPVGGYDINFATSQAIPTYRSILQSVRIPLTEFTGVSLSQVRGVRLTFDETQTGSINLANIRFNR